MNTAKDYLQEDMHKKPEQLQREADDVRADFEHTIDELANQFSPGELFNQAVAKFRNGDGAFITNLSDQIRNNPLPAILAGVSITWLMSASKQPPARAPRSAGHGMSSKVETAREKMSSATSHARSTTHDVTAGVKEHGHRVASGASELGHRANEAGHRTMDKARHGMRAARDNYNYMIEEQPLVVGALAIAVGAALGAMLPRTSTENHLMGEYSDKQRDELKHKAEDIKEKAEESVESKLHEHREKPLTGAAMAFTQNYTTDAPSREQINETAGPLVVEFGTEWCGHCQAAQPLLTEAFENHQSIRHLKVEDGKGRRLGRTFGVKLWPTLVFMRDGEEVARLVRPGNSNDIKQALAKIAS